jgi:hypothetical protein
MRHERCLVTYRLSAPCACCRQPAWRAHARGLEIYCATCCGCGRGGGPAGRDAARVKPSEAAPGHEARTADRAPAENRPRTGLPAGAGASPGHGWWGSTGRPDPGPPEALSGPARDLAARGLPAPEAARKASLATLPPAMAGPAGQDRTSKFAPRLAAKHFPARTFWAKSC